MSPTYDYTGDGNNTDLQAEFYRQDIMIKRVVNVAAVIASDTTLTTNGVIAAADVVQLVDIPIGFVFQNALFRTVTPEGAALTADIGIAGSNEIFSNLDLNQSAGAIDVMSVAATWGVDNVMGVAFTAVDTIDMQFDHETDAGEWELFIIGRMLVDF